MEAFELRLWDGRLGRWLTVDPAGEFHSPYLGIGNDPVNAIDPDGGDIIYLNDSKAVNHLGHAAVLIGNDKDGWRYLSMNGTGEGRSAVGDSKNADLGDIKYNKKNKLGNDFRGTGLKSHEVIKLVNSSNINEKHHYDRAIRIRTNTAEDEIAYKAAKKQAGGKTYGLLGSSCIDVPQEAFAAVLANRIGQKELSLSQEFIYGFDTLTPNLWYEMMPLIIFQINFDIEVNKSMHLIDSNTQPIDYHEVSSSPRHF